MSYNIRTTGVAVIIALSIGAVGGFIVGDHNAKPAPKTVSSIVVRQTIEPYTGVGSGVFKHGTIVRLDDNGQPVVIGNFNEADQLAHPGTWVIHKLVTEK